MSNIYLVATTGQFSKWRWFQVIFPLSELMAIQSEQKNKIVYRVKVVSEVEEIYSQKGVSNLLQRAFDQKRLLPLKEYLLKQKERYINNLTVAIYGGEPEWLPIDLKASSLLEIDADYGEDYWEEFGKCFGIVKLSGKEILFVLDGQHRIMALREAVKTDKSLLKQSIAVTLISHEHTESGRKKTRRLFTTINRYAKPVALGESILLDEDDLSAIITRYLIEEYSLFKGQSIIALNKSANLNLSRDKDKFSTVIALWNINEMLINRKEVYSSNSGKVSSMVRIRPKDEIIKKYKVLVFNYWDKFFSIYKKAKDFVNEVNCNIRINGGPYSLRPIGQLIFCEYFIRMKELNRSDELDIIKRVPDDLSNEFWHNVLYDPIGKRMMTNKSYARDYLFYHLGFSMSDNQMHKLLNNYKKYTKNDTAELPNKLIGSQC